MDYLIVIVAYSIIVLAFVPLGKIGRAQDWVKAKIKKIKDKIED